MPTVSHCTRGLVLTGAQDWTESSTVAGTRASDQLVLGYPIAQGRERQALDCQIRPSDRRGPGRDPGPPCAFKVSMFNVSCNSH